MDETRRANLQYLFNPQSVAILGASADLKKVSGRPLAYMRRFGYPGRIYPINPKYREIAGVPCFAAISDVPGKIDLLMVIIPAKEVLPNLEAALAKQVKVAVIISGGFAETGEEGKQLQDELTAFARRTGMLIYGPNTTGFLSMVHRTIVTFSQSLEVVEDLVPGRTGLITQSGAFGGSIVVRAMRAGLGLTFWAATGNEADLEFCDFLEYMVGDPYTQVIAGFLAGVEDGQRLMRGLELAAQKGKPVVLLKVGGTEAAKRAAYSHTGAIVGSARVYDAVFKQKGVIVARDVPELIDYSLALSTTPLPKGKKVGILTESGGGGVLLTERCSELGLEVPEIRGTTGEKLRAVVPALGSVKNPVDLTGQSLTDPSLIKAAAEVMLQVEDFDMVVPMLLMSEATAERKATDLLNLLQTHGKDKTTVVCWPDGPAQWVRTLAGQGIHVSETATRCARTLHRLSAYADFQRRRRETQSCPETEIADLPANRKEKALELIRDATQKGELRLDEYDAKKILQAYGIASSMEALADSPEDAVNIARRIGYPVAAKLISPDIPHKTEAQVVALNVESDDQLRQAYEGLVQRGRAYRPGARIKLKFPQDLKGILPCFNEIRQSLLAGAAYAVMVFSRV